MEKMIEEAKARGVAAIAFTDHCDWDYLDIKGYWYLRQIKLKSYVKALDEVAKGASGIRVAKGIELGFSDSATKKYLKEMPFSEFDYIINSAHTAGGEDVYFKSFFKNRDMKEAYALYLTQVEKSLDAPYPYHGISHIGYVAKNAPYGTPLLYEDFPETIDRILKKIIDKDKSLEINSNIKTDDFMPNISILRRYRELGGTNIIFGSDAHVKERIGENYQRATELVRSLGFTHWTVYFGGLPERAEF